MTLRVFLAAVKRYWKTFATTAAVVLAVGLIWLLLTPAQYVSTTRLMVSVEGTTTAAAYQNAQVVAGRVDTYIALLTSEVVDQRVIDKLKLPESPQELAGKVNATIVPPRTSLIDIAVTDESAERARLIAQTLADEFVKFADAMETPTGDDGQKVHTTIVTSATAPHQQRAARIALGGLAALAALVLGAAAVWIRSARDPVLRMAGPDATSGYEPPTKTHAVTPPPETVEDTAPVPQRAAAADEPPVKTNTVPPPETVEDTAPVPQTTAAADEPPVKTNAVPPPETVEDTAPVPQTTAAADEPPAKTSKSAPPRTIDVFEEYRRLQARLRATVDRVRRPVALRRLTKGGQQPDGTSADGPPGKTTASASAPPRTIDVLEESPTIGHLEPLPQGFLEAAEPHERTPWLLGFLCLLTPMMCAYVVPAGPLKSNGSPAKVISVLLFGLAVLGFFLVRRIASTRTVRPGVVIILLYFLVQLLVYGVGTTHLDSTSVEASKVRALITLVAHVGVTLYILARVHTSRQRNIVLGCLAIGLTFACVAGLLQSMTGIDLRFFIRPPGFVINTEDFYMGDRWGAKRVLGTSQHAIEFSLLAALTVPLTMHFARYAANRQVRWAAAAACILALLAMPAGISRTGVVGLAAIALVYMWNFKLRRIALALAVGSAMVVGYVLVLPGTAYALWYSITGASKDTSITTRIADYAQVSQTFRDNPVFGLGLGASTPTDYGILDNEWLQAIVQGGTLGILSMVVLVAGGIFGLNAALCRAKNPRERDQAYMLGSMIVAILACTFTFDLFSDQQVAGIFFMIFGLLWSNFSIPLPPVRRGDARPSPVQKVHVVELEAAAAR